MINVLLLAILACAPAHAGVASWYNKGRVTASGERFNPRGLTAAHRSLPFGTKVKVTNTRTKKSVIVRINDRGPFAKNRVIDLSQGAARQIGIKYTDNVKLVMLK